MVIRVYVEGVSDALGLTALLKDEMGQWRGRRISVQIRQLGGKGNLMREIGRKAQLALEQDGVDHVFALADLYPGHVDAQSLKQELCDLVESRLRPRFHAHAAVHDFEAWVLAAQDALCRRLGVAHLSGFSSPEEIDDQKPPVEHLKELFVHHKRTYQKEIDGPWILQRAAPAAVADKCPNFRLFYENLLACIAGR